MPRRKNPSFDLDVDAPERVADVLRSAADAYRESAGELSSSWGERGAGRVWNSLATILDRAASSCDKAVKRTFR